MNSNLFYELCWLKENIVKIKFIIYIIIIYIIYIKKFLNYYFYIVIFKVIF